MLYAVYAHSSQLTCSSLCGRTTQELIVGSMISRVRHLLEMIRFSHTIFALPFALLAAVMAWSTPTAAGHAVSFRWHHLLGILICMAAARSAAMAFNRLVDRRLDAKNPRTQQRHLPAGTLSPGSVVLFTCAASLVFLAGTLLFLPNYLPLILSLPVLVFLFAYSFTKRFTLLAHFWLGAALMLAPVSAWIAVRGEVLQHSLADLLPACLLGIAVLAWVAGFDIIYACQDADFDVQAQLHSVPSRLGVVTALRFAFVCHIFMILTLALLPWICPRLGLEWIYGSGIAAVGGLLLYEHWLVRPDDLTRVNIAFFQVNSLISLGLFGLTTLDLLV